jgi:hypothetical protein
MLTLRWIDARCRPRSKWTAWTGAWAINHSFASWPCLGDFSVTAIVRGKQRRHDVRCLTSVATAVVTLSSTRPITTIRNPPPPTSQPLREVRADFGTTAVDVGHGSVRNPCRTSHEHCSFSAQRRRKRRVQDVHSAVLFNESWGCLFGFSPCWIFNA